MTIVVQLKTSVCGFHVNFGLNVHVRGERKHAIFFHFHSNRNREWWHVIYTGY